MIRVSKVESETPQVNTFFLESSKININAEPGQFIMAWVPGVDEIPLSVSEVEPAFAITVKKVGDATKALYSLKKGDRVGIRGPYGHPFSLKGKYILIVGGGIGMAPLLFLTRELRNKKKNITIINGAKTESDIVFLSKLQQLSAEGIECIFTTDDGSFGEQGFATTVAAQKLKERSFDYVYTCGPEAMMWELFKTTENLKIPLEASLERFMKCGLGICGSCCLDPLGYRVCVEGPVFSSDLLRKISDFGKYERTPDGKKVKI